MPILDISDNINLGDWVTIDYGPTTFSESVLHFTVNQRVDDDVIFNYAVLEEIYISLNMQYNISLVQFVPYTLHYSIVNDLIANDAAVVFSLPVWMDTTLSNTLTGMTFSDFSIAYRLPEEISMDMLFTYSLDLAYKVHKDYLMLYTVYDGLAENLTFQYLDD